MINYKTGNILDFTEEAIGHGCNCRQVMGAGVAKAIKQKFPELYKADLSFTYKPELRLGRASKAHLSNGKVGYNLYTQLNYGSGLQISYDAIRESLKYVFEDMVQLGLSSLALPRIGAGLGGGDWNKILSIIEKVSNEYNIDITIYSL